MNKYIIETQCCIEDIEIFLRKSTKNLEVSWFDIKTVLKEAINNIFEHGKPPGELYYKLNKKYFIIFIKDQSEGFEFDKNLNRNLEKNKKESLLEDSRGLFIITSLVDAYDYIDGTLILKFKREDLK